MKNNFTLHQAKPENIQMIDKLLKETALWLKSKGSLQWNGILEGKDNHDTVSAINRGEVFYGKLNDEIVGMLILWDQQSKWDADLWGEDQGNDFYYLHRLIIKRDKAGKGNSHLMINAAKEYAQDKQKKGLRLDCIAGNEVLNHMYLKEKFEFIQCKEDFNAEEQLNDFNLYQYEIE
ncbi:GNAT family N-acetyltransferase [Carnobacterium pleistocenium]|uniref:GNAT family N-acetyltransferase n=1 Tax=Carnobacterium pleistocenium TaxID=181073 RepID=UPI00054FE854|nr:GNAT family N-acetyltransferase [Carnobacterium pleistocenium]